jgi:predicted amidohydrolase YtcJ
VLLTGGRAPEPVDLRVADGRVVACAPRLEPEKGEPVLDLGGRLVRRGLRDAHVHFAQWARSRRELDLSEARSAQAAAHAVAHAAARLPPGEVLRGGGFRDALWPEAPTRDVLDRAAPGCAVVLGSLDLHTVWLSGPALALCGLSDHPTGVLGEHEAWEALARLPRPSRTEDDAAAKAAVTAAHTRGVTAIRDFDFEDAHTVWRHRQQSGAIGLRVTAVVMPAQLPSYVGAGLRTGDVDGLLRVGPVKLFVDGSLGSRTARCLHPYAGTSDRGQLLLDPGRLRLALREVQDAGFAAAVHAIGDEANRDALHALAEVGVRASIEHVQLIRREDVGLFARSGIIASLQPAHLLDDHAVVDHHWQDSPSIPYAVGTLVRAGARVVFGSDGPVSPLDPWLSIAAAVHRTNGRIASWHPEQAVPLEVALAASGARRVRAGDLADLVVLDVPHLEGASASDLCSVPVHATCLAGRWVHGPWVQAR